MNEFELKTKLLSYKEADAIPSIIMYGDSLWKRGIFGYKLLPLPGGREYSFEPVPPKARHRIGQIVTVDKTGLSFDGLGSIAANLTAVESSDEDLYNALHLIFNADSRVAGIAFSTKEGHVMDWIDRGDLPSV